MYDSTFLHRRQLLLDEATQHAAHLLVLLDPHRRSIDPELRAAYDDAHELISDLAALYAVLLTEPARAVEDGDPGPPLPAAS